MPTMDKIEEREGSAAGNSLEEANKADQDDEEIKK